MKNNGKLGTYNIKERTKVSEGKRIVVGKEIVLPQQQPLQGALLHVLLQNHASNGEGRNIGRVQRPLMLLHGRRSAYSPGIPDVARHPSHGAYVSSHVHAFRWRPLLSLSLSLSFAPSHPRSPSSSSCRTKNGLGSGI